MHFHYPLAPSHCALMPPHQPLKHLSINCPSSNLFTLSMFNHFNPTELDYPVKIKPNTGIIRAQFLAFIYYVKNYI